MVRILMGSADSLARATHLCETARETTEQALVDAEMSAYAIAARLLVPPTEHPLH